MIECFLFIDHEDFVRLVALDLCNVDKAAVGEVDDAYGSVTLRSVRILFDPV